MLKILKRGNHSEKKAYKKSIFVGIFYGLMIFALTATYIYADNYSWTQRSSSVYYSAWRSVAGTENGDIIYAANYGNYISKSSDGGESWVNITTTGTKPWTSVAVSDNGSYLIASAEGDIYRSTDGGINFSIVYSGSVDFVKLSVSNDGTYMVGVTEGGGIYYSSENGTSWSEMATGYKSAVVSADGSSVYAIDNTGNVYAATGYSSSLSLVTFSLGAYAPLIDIDTSSNGSKVIIISNSRVFLNSDALNSSSFSDMGLTGSDFKNVVMSNDGLKAIISSLGGNIYTSIDMSTWSTESTISGPQWLWAIFFNRSSKVALVSSNSYIYTGVDVVQPVIKTVTSTTENGTYSTGSSINILITFSEPVTTNGSVTVNFDAGGSCSFSISTPSSSVGCTYNVEAGYNSDDLTVSSIVPNEGVNITDIAQNLLTDFSPTVSNLAYNSDIVIHSLATPGTPDLDVNYDSGYSSNDNITNNPEIFFYVSCQGALTVYLNSNITGNISSGTCSDSSVYLSVSGLSDGNYDVYAYQSDGVENSSNSNSMSLTIDTAPPSAPSTTDLLASSDTGASSTDNITSDSTPTFSGSCTSSHIIKLYIQSSYMGQVTCSATSSYSITPTTISDGVKNVLVTETDIAGNTSDQSPGLSVTIDTSAPSAPTSLDLNSVSDVGASSTDNVTASTTLSISGSCTTGFYVQLYSDSVSSGSSVMCVSGSFTAITGILSEGTHSITAKQTDVAGNQSVNSTALSVSVDVTSPSAPSQPDMSSSSDLGFLSTDNITSTTTLTFTGNSCEASSTLQLYINGVSSGVSTACSAGSYSLTSDTIAVGSHTVTIKQTDLSGNISASSTGLTVVIDTTSASISNLSLSNNGTSVLIAWNTDKEGASWVDYGLTSSYTASSTYNSTASTTHSISLSGLTIGTTYHYRPVTLDIAGNRTVNFDLSFIATAQATSSGGSSGSSGSTQSSGASYSSGGNSGGYVLFGLNGSKIGNLTYCPTGYTCIQNSNGSHSMYLNGLSTTTGVLVNNINHNLNSSSLNNVLNPVNNTGPFVKNLFFGARDVDVARLQKFLNSNGFAVSKSGVGSKGRETSFFGYKTMQALIKFQKAFNINPAQGFFGSITRGLINTIISNQ